ncbi:MAG: glycosyltransferase family 39 protein [Thermodesulfobacteria bacterium]|nr:glycosyltransferase family 39 protein [Thermodesulfobacteriota bacterium]
MVTLLAARLMFTQQIGLELSPDEAYYWDWSRHLAWGYFSKPPMVAWLIHLFTKYLGTSEYSVRVPAVLCGTFYLAFIYYLGQRLFDRKVGLWAAFAAAASPLASIYSFVMTIDPPLIFFWAWALCLGWQAAETRRLKDFFFLGLIFGLGLLSKQTMIAFGAMYFLWLYLDPQKRALLRHPGPYLALIVAGLLIAPNLWWNVKHGWITFKHTSHHFSQQGFFFSGPLLFLLEQAGVVTPITFFLMIFVFFTFLKSKKLQQNSSLFYLFTLSAVPLALVFPLSFLRRINANWPFPFYAAGYILLAALILRGKWPPKRGALLRRLFFLGVLLGMFVAILVYQLPRKPSDFPPKVQRLLYKFYGWKDLARETAKYLEDDLFVVTSKRYYASELAFYLPGRPRTYTFWQGEIRSQYDLWDGLPQMLSRDALVVLKSKAESERFSVCFEKLEFLEEWKRDIFGKKRRVLIYRGYRLRECPYLGGNN